MSPTWRRHGEVCVTPRRCKRLAIFLTRNSFPKSPYTFYSYGTNGSAPWLRLNLLELAIAEIAVRVGPTQGVLDMAFTCLAFLRVKCRIHRCQGHHCTRRGGWFSGLKERTSASRYKWHQNVRLVSNLRIKPSNGIFDIVSTSISTSFSQFYAKKNWEKFT